MQLHETYADRLHVIALNVDFDDEGEPPDELKQQVGDTLSKQAVTCETIMCSDSTDRILEAYEVFSLPAALVFDAQGELIKKFDGTVDYPGTVDPYVKELLANAGGLD